MTEHQINDKVWKGEVSATLKNINASIVDLSNKMADHVKYCHSTTFKYHGRLIKCEDAQKEMKCSFKRIIALLFSVGAVIIAAAITTILLK